VAFFGQVVAPGGDLARGDGTLRGYGAREQTRTGHLREVAGYLSWRTVWAVHLQAGHAWSNRHRARVRCITARIGRDH